MIKYEVKLAEDAYKYFDKYDMHDVIDKDARSCDVPELFDILDAFENDPNEWQDFNVWEPTNYKHYEKGEFCASWATGPFEACLQYSANGDIYATYSIYNEAMNDFYFAHEIGNVND